MGENGARASQVYFNSIKVQLKLRNIALVEYVRTNFNSIKVQLKRSQYFRHKKGHDKFQFHKGTIKALAVFQT